MVSGILYTSFSVDWYIHIVLSTGDPNLRTLDPSSFAQQAITFLCLDFTGTSRKFNELPRGKCPSGIRSQIVSGAIFLLLIQIFEYFVEFPELLGRSGI